MGFVTLMHSIKGQKYTDDYDLYKKTLHAIVSAKISEGFATNVRFKEDVVEVFYCSAIKPHHKLEIELSYKEFEAELRKAKLDEFLMVNFKTE